MLLVVLSACVASATVIPQTVEQLTDRATVVVRATVGAQASEMDSGPAGISTVTELRVVEVLKGSPPPSLRLRQVGGRVGAKRVELPGDAALAQGEDVLVFLKCATAASECTLVGLSQGKYHLAPRSRGVTQASRDFSQTSFVRGPPLGAGPEPYAALAQRVRARAGVSR